MPELKSWGITWTPEIPYSGDWCCRNCGWYLPFGKKFFDYFTGFLYEPQLKAFGTKIAGKIIIECPRCHKVFWFHIGVESVEDAISAQKWSK